MAGGPNGSPGRVRGRSSRQPGGPIAAAIAVMTANNQVASLLSHELNTPLSVVMAAIETLADDARDQILPSDAREDLFRLINQNIARLRQNISRLILFTQLEWELEHGVQPPHVYPDVDLNDAIAIASSLLAETNRDKGVELALELAPDLPPLTCSPDRLEACVHELIGNLYKFAPPRGQVGIRTSPHGTRHVAMELRNAQTQIDRRKLQLVYLPFWQAENLNTRHSDGLGLGIPIAKRLANSLGGDLNARLEDGGALVFDVVLPLQPGDA